MIICLVQSIKVSKSLMSVHLGGNPGINQALLDECAMILRAKIPNVN